MFLNFFIQLQIQGLSQGKRDFFKIAIYSGAIFWREYELEKYILHWRSVKISWPTDN